MSLSSAQRRTAAARLSRKLLGVSDVKMPCSGKGSLDISSAATICSGSYLTYLQGGSIPSTMASPLDDASDVAKKAAASINHWPPKLLSTDELCIRLLYSPSLCPHLSKGFHASMYRREAVGDSMYRGSRTEDAYLQVCPGQAQPS